MLAASYNVHYGIGNDDCYDFERVLSEVANADIIALQEVEIGWARTNHDDQLELIKRFFPDHTVAWGPNIDTVATGGSNGRRQHGNVVVSRYPILSIRNYLLPKYGSLDFLDQQKGMLEALIDTPLGPIRVYSTHFCGTVPAQTLLQAERLLAHHHSVEGRGPVLSGDHADPSWTSEPALPPMPVSAIVMGDLNLHDTSPAYELLVGDYAPRYGNLTRRDGFLDAWVHCNKNMARDDRLATGATCLGNYNERIDYCLVTPDLRPSLTKAWVDREAVGSDHQPLFVEFGGQTASA